MKSSSLRPAISPESNVSDRRSGDLWIAVLPLKVQASDSELEVFSESLVDDVTAGLARFPHLRVGSINGIHGTEQRLSPLELLLRYFLYIQQYRPDEHAILRDAFERIVERESSDANAWAALSNLYLHEYVHLINPRENPLERANQAAWHALQADSASQMGWQDLAAVYFYGRDLNAFYPAAERAMAIDPRAGTTCGYLGMLIAFSGQYERGVEIVRRMMALNPHHSGWYYYVLWFGHYRKGEYGEALKVAKQVNTPELFWTHMVQAISFGQLGRLEEARVALEAMRKTFPLPFDEVSVREQLGKWFPETGALDHLFEGLHKAGFGNRLDP